MPDYNLFNLSNELAKAITNIICTKEGTDYVCKLIKCNIPEHTEMVPSTTTKAIDYFQPNYDPIASGNMDRSKLYIEYDILVEKTISEEEYDFLAVMDKNTYQVFSRIPFKSEEEIERILKSLSVVFMEYDGVFDSNIFQEKFPYLQIFFDSLNEWRKETGRLTVDDDILKTSMEKVLKENTHQKGLRLNNSKR